MRAQLANAILRGEGTAKERLARRKAGPQAGGMQDETQYTYVLISEFSVQRD